MLVARQNGGVRNRQAQRAAEQSGNGKPIGQRAHHRRFGKGFHVAQRRILAHIHGCRHKQQRCQKEQPRGQAAAFSQAQPRRFRARWLPWLASQLPALLNVAKPEQVARFGSMMLAEQYSGDKIGKTLADALALLKSQGLHQTLLRALMKQTRHWLRDPQTRALLEQNLHEWAARIESEAPSAWEKIKASLKGSLVDRVDGWVAAKALDWADDYLAAALADPEHRLRKNVDEQIERIGEALRHSRLWHKRLEAGKRQLAHSDAVQQSLARMWQSLQTWTAADVQQADSLWLVQLNKLLDHMLAQAAQYPQFMRRADVRLSLMVRDGVMRYKEQAAQFVSDKVKGWDSREMVEKLELSVGRDLQFIRINGTLVGGLVGLVIYSVSQWLF